MSDSNTSHLDLQALLSKKTSVQIAHLDLIDLVVLDLEDEANALVFIAVVDVLVAANLVGLAVGYLHGIKGGADFDAGNCLNAIVAGNLDVAHIAVYELQFEGITVLVFRDLAIPQRMVFRLYLCRRAVYLLDIIRRSAVLNPASNKRLRRDSSRTDCRAHRQGSTNSQ